MARNFDNVSSQVLSYSGAVVSSMPITMAVHFRFIDNLGTSLFSISDANSTDFYRLYYDTGNVLKLRHTDGSTNGDAITVATFTTGVWSHAAAVFASTTSRSVYLDGGNKISDTTNVNAVTDPDTTALGALYYNSSVIAYADSDFAEWGIWNVALTDAEVATLAAGYSPLFVRPASLVAYWPLIGRTSPEIDIVGGYNMTLTNGPTTAAHPKVFYPSVTLNPQQPVSSVLAHYQKIKVVSTLPDTSDVIPGGAQGILVQGQIADDEISAGNPIQTAGTAKASDGTDPGSVVESDNATIITDLNRSQLINTSHPNFWDQTENYTDSQTNNQLEVNPGAGLSLYVESVNVSAGTPMEIEFVEDTAGAGTVILGPYYLPANGQLSYTFSPPIKVTENVNFGFTSRVGGDDNPHTVSATGYIGPA